MKYGYASPVCCLIAGVILAAVAGQGYAADPTLEDLGPVGEIEKLHGDLKFTEGPADDGEGRLYFTDIPADRIYRISKEGKLDIFLEPAGHCNGLMFDAAGNLFACSMDGRLIRINVETKDVTVLTEEYERKRYNAPNDLVIDSSAGIYFTDPHFRAPTPLPQKVPAVYYHAAGGKVTRVATITKAPNGVILSPDEKTLYVVPSLQSEVLAYPVEAPGKLGEERVFCTLKQPEGVENTGGDGLTVDTQGNLYITSRLGVQVYTPAGKLLGVIEFPEQPANVTFGGKDRRTLYATCRTGVYAVKMKAQGWAFPGRSQ